MIILCYLGYHLLDILYLKNMPFSVQLNLFLATIYQETWKSLLTGGWLLLNESSTEKLMTFLYYFHAAISNHLSEKPKICPLNTVLTVFTCK